MAVISAFSKCLVPPTPGEVTPPPETADKNWNPGNYLEGTSNGQWDAIKSIISTANDPLGKWKGAMMRISWPALESTEGVYPGMDTIQNWLDQIAAYPGKRLIVFIQMKTFGATSRAVPAYMRTNAIYADPDGFGTGDYPYASGHGGPGGYIPNMHVNAVRVRFDAMMDEFATRFNNNPNLEAVVMSEAAITAPVGAPGGWSFIPWIDGMVDGLSNMRTKLSNIQISQWINARNISDYFVPQIRTIGIGLGMTDVCEEEAGFNYRNDIPGQEGVNIGNIQHCQESNGLAIITGHMSAPAMAGCVVGRNQVSGTIQGQPHVYPTYPGPGKTRQNVFDFAVNTVGVTHCIWIYNTTAMPATGTFDPNGPASQDSYTTTSDAYSGTYAGKSYQTVTTNWIKNSPNIVTQTARPTGWT